ncbi:UDP-3-O-acyl N-acetylglucosamine deacetylase, partial [Dillenia turbinata]
MTFARTITSTFKSSALLTWKPTGTLQHTIADCIEKSGKALHSGELTRVKLWPESARKGRYFEFHSTCIPASISFVEESPLCTTLSKDGFRVRTVEHLLSALEASGVDNCRIEIQSISGGDNPTVEGRWTSMKHDMPNKFVSKPLELHNGAILVHSKVPIFDGSAREWIQAIEQVGLKEAADQSGSSCEKLAPFLNEPVHVQKNDSFLVAFPSPKLHVTYGIDFPRVPAIGCQWFHSAPLEDSFYSMEIASARTFCLHEEVEKMRNAGLIKGGSKDNAIVCSASEGWLNPPLRFPDEPCRHKVLDLLGDLSLIARDGNQGLPVVHIVAFKA